MDEQLRSLAQEN